MIFKFANGDKVKDRISGYVGVITGRTEWLNGCVRYCVQAASLDSGKVIPSETFDEEQLELIDACAVQPWQPTPQKELATSGRRPGGPRPNASQPETKR